MDRALVANDDRADSQCRLIAPARTPGVLTSKLWLLARRGRKVECRFFTRAMSGLADPLQPQWVGLSRPPCDSGRRQPVLSRAQETPDLRRQVEASCCHQARTPESPQSRHFAVVRAPWGIATSWYPSMALVDPDLRRTWLFGPGANSVVHDAMQASGADALIVDLEDFTPPARREEARRGLGELLQRWRAAGRIVAVRINALDADGPSDLAAAMPARPDVISYPMSVSAMQMQRLHEVLAHWEATLGIGVGSTEILPVCETALGVADVRAIAGASPRIRSALLGAEDLAADLCAERQPDAVELDHARRRFLLECRAAVIEPIDAPYTFSDVDGAARETHYARRLGYRCKSLVRPEHAQPLNAALTPGEEELRRAAAIVDGFEAARARGEDRALVEGLWVEVPTYRNAQRLIERARRLNRRC